MKKEARMSAKALHEQLGRLLSNNNGNDFDIVLTSMETTFGLYEERTVTGSLKSDGLRFGNNKKEETFMTAE